MTSCPRCGADFSDAAVSYCGFCGAPVAHEERAPGDDPLIGHIVDDRYRIVARIGEGGMGTVYKVEHVSIRKFMALKLLKKEYSASADIVRRFKREAQAASRLSNVHTVVVFDSGRTADGALYIAMEWVEGESLLALLAKEGPFPWRRAAKVALQVAISLSEAHEKGVVHRDLKPENIMVVRSKQGGDFVKILDFGLAKMVELDHAGESITTHGSIVGTPYYMSPEQIRGDDVDARADVYSLGAVVYRLLCGEPPFLAKHPMAILQRHLNDPVPPLFPRMGGRPLPPPLEDLVMRSLAKDRESRPSSAEEVRERIESVLSDATGARPRVVLGAPTPENAASPITKFDDWQWDTELRISDRRDWEVFERGLRRRRVMRLVIAFLLLGGLGGAIAFKAVEDEWFAATREDEPNNDPEHATRLIPGRPLKGQIGKRISMTRGDQDFYAIETPKGGGENLVRVDVVGFVNMDLEVSFYSRLGGERLAYANQTGAGGREAICKRRLPNEGALVVVREHARPGAPPIENVSDDYTIVATVSAPVAGEEVEPNDQAENANPLAIGAWVSGVICDADDEDWYRVDTRAVQGKALKIEFAPGQGAEKARLQLYSKDRVPTAGKVEVGTDLVFAMVRGTRETKGEAPYRLRVIAN